MTISFQNRRRQIAVNYYPKKKKKRLISRITKKKKKIATEWTAELKDLLIKQNSQLAKYKLKWKAVEITLFSQSIKLTYCYMVNRSSFMKKEKKKKKHLVTWINHLLWKISCQETKEEASSGSVCLTKFKKVITFKAMMITLCLLVN